MKKYFWFFALLMFVSGFFVTNFPSSPIFSLLSNFFVLILAIPSYYYFCKLCGYRNGIIIISVLSLFAIILEGYAILSGFPYGYFTYSEKMGYKLFDLVPWTVPFAYVPLLLGIISIFGNRKSKTDLILVPILLVLADLIIDPGAVKLGLWAYIDTSFFYSVPLSNFLGWFLSGLVGYAIFNYSTILLKFRKSQAPVVINHKVAISLLLILIFWTSVDIWTGLIIPAFLGIFFVFYLCFLLSKRI